MIKLEFLKYSQGSDKLYDAANFNKLMNKNIKKVGIFFENNELIIVIALEDGKFSKTISNQVLMKKSNSHKLDDDEIPNRPTILNKQVSHLAEKLVQGGKITLGDEVAFLQSLLENSANNQEKTMDVIKYGFFDGNIINAAKLFTGELTISDLVNFNTIFRQEFNLCSDNVINNKELLTEFEQPISMNPFRLKKANIRSNTIDQKQLSNINTLLDADPKALNQYFDQNLTTEEKTLLTTEAQKLFNKQIEGTQDLNEKELTLVYKLRLAHVCYLFNQNFNQNKQYGINDHNQKIQDAFELHNLFVAIHPFGDGNGRVARFLLYAYLRKNGVLLNGIAKFSPLYKAYSELALNLHSTEEIQQGMEIANEILVKELDPGILNDKVQNNINYLYSYLNQTEKKQK
ncbi:MAG: hypothetical protein E6Q89_03425 [Bacteroidia bacterium]|nr:MAG: hypothetical protein E6Q89_03425 [Bacteroidia bacterium]